MRIDGDFEDREGHQAPFTLREEEESLRKAGKQEGEETGESWTLKPLFLLSCFPERFSGFRLLNLRDDRVEVGPFAGVEFGVEQFAIGADFERAAAGWNQGERCNSIAEFEDLSRQTDGFRCVVSNRAVFDPDLGFHQVLLSTHEGSGLVRLVKKPPRRHAAFR